MKIKYVALVLIVFGICCFGADNYNVLVNPQNPDIQSEPNSQTLFILDYSNSMNEMLIDKTKYALLLDSLKVILSKMSAENKIGVRVYGQRWGLTPIDACRATSLVVPISEGNFGNISSTLSRLSPKGMTPITYALKQAVKNDFRGFDGEKHIILITDGGENCDESPCDYAMELIKYRKDIKIDVIALNIDSEEDLDQLRCTSTVTSGKFYRADTQAELIHSLNESFNSRKRVDAKILY
jgi:Ca-activated chloride channel family protein